ncbi:Alkaline phosphatase PafA [termite gut metagenome]|uniref:Alkaline phosphatase PafA n=1 Tax=termite gut metagenome TaxID=433724 RepID=A0A5J4SE73_9ZZZZ
MKKRHVFTSIVTLLTFTSLPARSLPPAPKLIVGITIDQLRTDYIEAFFDLFGENGFKRLWKEGKIYRNVEYPFANPDRASAVATLYTGTTPSSNGIISEYWIDRPTLRLVHCTDDSAFMGNYTTENSSPMKLLTSTIADELKIATQGRGLVYAISPFRETAIFAAGHSGDGAFWLNNSSGKWCGTTFYGDFPLWVSRYNDGKALNFRIDNLVWSPLLPENRYTYLISEWNKATFQYKFAGTQTYKYKRFITSPLVNDEVNALAEEFINNSLMGKDEITDLFSLTYYAGLYNNMSSLESAMELQDIYVRLDKNVAGLIELVEKNYGAQNVVFFITSAGYTEPEAPALFKYKIPTGEFYLNRCAALLNIYLMATYGEGQYVETYHNRQIYLNRKLIEGKQVSLTEIQNKAADFLIQFSGVNDVYSMHRLLLGTWTPQIDKIKNNFHRQRSGDMLIDVLPGWVIVNDNPMLNKVVRYAHAPIPLIFTGGGTKPEILSAPIGAEHIAPTLAYFMRIRAPNACMATPLGDVR